MTTLRPVFTVLAMATVLFVWSGVTQCLPWGVPTTPQYDASGRPPHDMQSETTVRAAPGTWTTAAFDAQLGSSMLTLTTERTFAWIVAVPITAYDPARYFALELAAQLAVSLGLVALTLLTKELSRSRRLGAVAIAALAASVASYGQMMNWWGMPAWYGIGMSANLTVGWLLAARLADWALVRPTG